MRKLSTALMLGIVVLILAACGGGGGGGGSNSDTTNGSANNGNGSNPANPGGNVVPVSVSSTGSSIPNLLLTTVKVCAPGSTTDCQTINNVLVDTGSVGLRVLASAISALPLQPSTTAGGLPLGECTQFADGFVWGAVRKADIHIGGETASNTSILSIGDASVPTVPSLCSSGGGQNEDTAAKLGANGVLGVGLFQQDCGAACAAAAMAPFYYGCSGSTCTPTSLPLANQVQNPVSMFASNNNGVLIQLPAVPNGGVASVSGSMIFGIGTASNNALGSAQIYTTTNNGTFTAVFNGATLPTSFLDSGSNAFFFANGSTPECASNSNAPGFYCPTATQSLSAMVQGANGTNSTIDFTVMNASSLVSNNSLNAFSTLAGPALGPGIFDFGLPFFFGRNVFTAIQNEPTPAGNGPYWAF